MKPLIATPAAICQIGNRSINEDRIYPELGQGRSTDDLFIVCDGIGGAQKGELASKLACQGFVDFFKEKNISISTTALLNEAVLLVEKTFEEYIKKDARAKGMGTTLTLVHFHEQGATLSHCGDSRIYHVRKGEILFQTEDHSLVNEMVQHKILSKEEAVDHPKKNVITRAIQANAKKARLDTHFITDIKAGDYFFMCTDGILEQVTSALLAKILNGKISPQDGINVISNYCEGKTRDNYSAYLIQVEEQVLEKKNLKRTNIALIVLVVLLLSLLATKLWSE